MRLLVVLLVSFSTSVQSSMHVLVFILYFGPFYYSRFSEFACSIFVLEPQPFKLTCLLVDEALKYLVLCGRKHKVAACTTERTRGGSSMQTKEGINAEQRYLSEFEQQQLLVH